MGDRYDLIPDVFPVLHSDALLLREVDSRDIDNWFARNSDPEVATTVGGDPMTDRSEAVAAIESVRAAFRDKTRLRWSIVPTHQTAAVGSTGFNVFSQRDRSAELGYGIAKGYWGRGIMTDATRLALDYAFRTLDLNRIEASVLDDNARSILVLGKLGLQREGLAREYKLVGGRMRDFWVFSLLRRDWDTAPP